MNNIILLPETKNKLMAEAREALQAGNYIEASELYKMLVEGNAASYEVHVNLLISLMKAKQLDEAEHYAEEFVEMYANDEHLQIVELLVMILFEKNAFSDAIHLMNETFTKDLPEAFKQRLEAIYQICYEQNVLHSKMLLEHLAQAIKDENHREQWILLNKWDGLQVKLDEVLVTYVQDPTVHPVIKSKILEQLSEHQYEESVRVEKFGQVMTVKPNQLLHREQAKCIDELLLAMETIEHKNPTLYSVIKELIYDYSYVMYPFTYQVKATEALKQAFMIIGKEYAIIPTENGESQQDDSDVMSHISNIEICHQLYTSITSRTM